MEDYPWLNPSQPSRPRLTPDHTEYLNHITMYHRFPRALVIRNIQLTPIASTMGYARAAPASNRPYFDKRGNVLPPRWQIDTKSSHHADTKPQNSFEGRIPAQMYRP